MQFYEVDTLNDLDDLIDKTESDIWNPVFEQRLTPWDRLMALDIDTNTTSDEEAQVIIRSIEAEYSLIVQPEDV